MQNCVRIHGVYIYIYIYIYIYTGIPSMLIPRSNTNK